jgi:hypothetical protein
MEATTKHKVIDYTASAVVGAGVVAGVVAVMGGSREAIMYGALGGAIAGLVGKPIAGYIADSVSGLTTATVPAAPAK